jgi:hypothetical protein
MPSIPLMCPDCPRSKTDSGIFFLWRNGKQGKVRKIIAGSFSSMKLKQLVIVSWNFVNFKNTKLQIVKNWEVISRFQMTGCILWDALQLESSLIMRCLYPANTQVTWSHTFGNRWGTHRNVSDGQKPGSLFWWILDFWRPHQQRRQVYKYSST